MRNGWRLVIPGIVAAVFGVTQADSAEGADRACRLTVEIGWNLPAGKAPPLINTDAGESAGARLALEVSEGQVVEVVDWPGSSSTQVRKTQGTWDLGSAYSGRVRARVSAPLGASLVLRAGGQALQVPLAAVVAGPQRSSPQAPFPFDVTVERLPWDVLPISLAAGDGRVAPGAKVPVKVAFNILAAETSEVNVRCSLELRPARGGETVWRQDVQAPVMTNEPDPAPTSFVVEMPPSEGTFVLEIRASWESPPTTEAATRLGRFLRKGTRGLIGGPTVSAVRRVMLVTLGDGTTPLPARFEREAGHDHEQEVDAIDLMRVRVHRPTASGRSPRLTAAGRAWRVPEEALAEPTRRDRLRGWVSRIGPESARLAPADASGLAWSAIGLKVAHPGRPHRLTLTFNAGNPTEVGVAVVGQGGAGPSPTMPARPRLLLDACASGPPVLPEGPAATFSWLVWPDEPDPVLVLVNRAEAEGMGLGVQVGSVSLTELAALPPAPAIESPSGTAGARGLGLVLDGPDVLERFGGSGDPGPADTLGAARNLAHYLTSCGANAAVLSDRLADRDRRRALDGQAAEDALGPDRLDLALRVLARQGVPTWLDLTMTGPLPGLPDPADPEAFSKGLVRVDRKGKADGPAYHPLNPDVRAAMKRRVTETVARYKDHAKLAGVLIRLGPGPTLLGAPDTGLDDATFARFAREAFDNETANATPGLDNGHDDPDRYEARSRFLAGPARVPWLTWRAGQIASFYGELAEAARQAAPGSTLAVATPELGDGPAGAEARRADLAGLDPGLAWKAVGLDLDAWPAGEHAPVVFRGVAPGDDDLAHDLATSPELDAKVAARPSRGLLLDDAPTPDAPVPTRGVVLNARPGDTGPIGDEPIGHGLAAIDPGQVWIAAGFVAGREERTRRFGQVFRALPREAAAAEAPTLAFGVAVRAARADKETYLTLANDSPYPIRVDAVLSGAPDTRVYDLGRDATLRPEAKADGRHLVLDLLPFAASWVRVDDPNVRVAKVTPYPADSVMAEIRVRYEELSAQLSQLSRAADKGAGADAKDGPHNPGFEPTAGRTIRMTGVNTPAVPPESAWPTGWKLSTAGTGASLTIDPAAPHSGRGSLRLDAPSPPASVVCDDFNPGGPPTLLVRAWLRADRPDMKVRLWVEGGPAARPFARVSELTAQPNWVERVVKVADVPPGGLGAARVRFEMLTPGTLWLDDLSVSGESMSEPERRNARNALLAAMQAYKDQRYADFARLAGSRRARRTAGGGGTGAAELSRTGDASALPPGRRLR